MTQVILTKPYEVRESLRHGSQHHAWCRSAFEARQKANTLAADRNMSTNAVWYVHRVGNCFYVKWELE